MSRSIIQTAFDHLVVAAATLGQGEDYIEHKLGTRPSPGGRHSTMGTHNSVLRLGKRSYLEVIAIDPEAAPPARPRWFELDRPQMRAALAASPRLIHWVARCVDIDSVRRLLAAELGPSHAASRGDLRWRITIPDDGHLPGEGVLPTLIEWADQHHPTDSMPDARVHLSALAATHQNPGPIRATLAALGLSEMLKVSYDAMPRLAALIATPRGMVSL